MVELLEDGVDPCCSDNKQRTPLHFASSQGYEKVGESQVQFNMLTGFRILLWTSQKSMKFGI